MRRKAIFGALLLIALAVLLGGTVFRDQVANARSLAQSVFVSNTSANPVPVTAPSALPVREQNLDGGNIRVHEEGVATVQQTGTPVAVELQSISGSTATYIIPAGERLVIQYVNGDLAPQSGDPAAGTLSVQGVQGQADEFTGQVVPGNPNVVFYLFSEPVTIYAAAGDAITWLGPPGVGSEAELRFSGYLIPA